MYIGLSIVAFTPLFCRSFLFFFNDAATTEIYTLSLHDALPISLEQDVEAAIGELLVHVVHLRDASCSRECTTRASARAAGVRSEEHTSELQSLTNLVCRLLLEKKKAQEHIKQARPALNSQSRDS